MRVGILTNSYPPNLNGVSRSVVNLEKSLQKLGIEVFIITPKVPQVIYQSNVLALSSYSAPQNVSSDLQVPYNYIDQTVRFIKKNQIDILHSQDTLIGGVEAVIIAMKSKIPCVHTYHTMVEDYDYFNFPGYKTFIRRYSQTVCDGYDAVVAVSPKTENYLYQIKVQSPIYQIPNVLILPQSSQNLDLVKNENEIIKPRLKNDIQNLDKNKDLKPNNSIQSSQNSQNSNFKQKFPNLPVEVENSFNFVTFGRIAKEKSLELGIEILEPLLQKYPIYYLIAGIGPEMENLQNLIKSKNLEHKVFLIGRYDNETLGDFCSFCDVFVNTSTSENLPTTDFEALSFGLPVVAIDDLAHRFFVENDNLDFLDLENIDKNQNNGNFLENNQEKSQEKNKEGNLKFGQKLEKKPNELQNEVSWLNLQDKTFVKFLEYIQKTQNKIEIQNQKSFQKWFQLSKIIKIKPENKEEKLFNKNKLFNVKILKNNSNFGSKINSKLNSKLENINLESDLPNEFEVQNDFIFSKNFPKMVLKLQNWTNKNQIWLNKNFPKIAELIQNSQENEAWQIGGLNPNIWERKIKLESCNKNIANLKKEFYQKTEKITNKYEEKGEINLILKQNLEKSESVKVEDNLGQKILKNQEVKGNESKEKMKEETEPKLANGFCVEIDKMTLCCQKLYLDKDLRQKLSQNARQTAQNLAKRQVELEYLYLYQKLIDQNNIEKLENNNQFSLIFENFEELTEKLQNSWQNWLTK